MKYKILYNTRISTKNYKEGDEIEFKDGTDELFIKRLIDIKCIEPVAGSEKPKETKNQRGTNVKEQEKAAKQQAKEQEKAAKQQAKEQEKAAKQQAKEQEEQGKEQADKSDDGLGIKLDDIED
ncbi:hypothetical protein [Campylobacter concisus]|uniref:hypothetical protein n=1 Tax=Campylobacter concisus TaxID=199 RepID=UPI000CD9807C|nr:hypothetical protein [Campylobacter concisus]